MKSRLWHRTCVGIGVALFALEAHGAKKIHPSCASQVVDSVFNGAASWSRYFDPTLLLRPEGPPMAGNPAYEEFVADVLGGMRGMATRLIKLSGYRGSEGVDDLTQWGFQILPYNWSYLATRYDPKYGTTAGYMIMYNIERQMLHRWIKPRMGLHGTKVNKAGQLIALATDRLHVLGQTGPLSTDALLKEFLDLLRTRREFAAIRRLKVRNRARTRFEAAEIEEEVMRELADQLRNRLGREPTDPEVLDQFQNPWFAGRPVTPERIDEWRRLSATKESSGDIALDDAVLDPAERTSAPETKASGPERYSSSAETTESMTFRELVLILCPEDTVRCWSRFSESEKQVLFLMEARRATPEEAADLLGLTRSWVLDVRKKALAKSRTSALLNPADRPLSLPEGLQEKDFWVRDHRRLEREINWIQHHKTPQLLPEMSTVQKNWLVAYTKEIKGQGMSIDLFRVRLDGAFPGRQGRRQVLFGRDGLGGLFQSPSEFWLALKQNAAAHDVDVRLLDLDIKHFGGEPSASMRLALRQELAEHIKKWESRPENQGRLAGREAYGMKPGQIPVSHRRAMGSHGEALLFSSQSDYWLYYKQMRAEEGRPILLLNVNILEPTPELIAERKREAIVLTLNWIRANPGRKLTKGAFGDGNGQIPVNHQKVIRPKPFVPYQNFSEFIADVKTAARSQGIPLNF